MMNKKKSLQIGLIGLGRMGRTHLRHLISQVKGVNVAAVADLVCRKEDFNNEFGEIPFFNDAQKILENPRIDVVVITTPTSTHKPLVEKAIHYRKHIFCEKPLDLSLEVTEELLNKAASAGVKLMLGFNRRFDPDFMQAQQSVAAGKIGRIQIIKITNRDPTIPSIEFIKTSGGMFMDFSIHDLDMARFIMNKKIVEIYAKGLVFMDKAVEEAGDIDTALITLTFEDGSYAVIDNSRKAVYGYDQRLEIFGDEGMILVDNNLHHQNILYDKNGIHKALPLNNFMARFERSYLKEMQLFTEAIQSGLPLPVSHEDIISATTLAYAAQKSLQSGMPVKL